MKKRLPQIATLIFAILLTSGFAYSANEQFRSAASGNWNSNSTWEMSTNGGSIWFAASSTPTDTSGAITIQTPNTVTVTVNVSADQLTVNNGGTISINNLITLTIKDGSGTDLTLNSGGTLSGAGTLQTQGAGVTIVNRNGSNFTAAFKVNSGVTASYDDGSPYIAIYKGAMTIDAGTTLNTIGGGYSNQANGTVTNNGTISGNRFIMNGATLTNNSSIAPATLEFNDTTSLAGTGTYTASAILIGNSGNVSLANNLVFSPITSFTINTGGTLNPNTRTFTLNSGTFSLNNGANVSNSGIFQTQGSVSMIVSNGSNFNAPFKVNTGTTTSNDNAPPYIANYKGTMTIDVGATLTTQGGGYSNRAYGTVINSGTITGNNFIMRGASMTNSGVINPTNFQFDSITALTSTGNFNGTSITIGGTGNVTLVSNVLFTPSSSFTINGGGVFQPGTKTFTFASGSFILNTGAVVSGVGPSAGIMQSQNNVVFLFRNGTTFNSAIKVNTGTLTAYNDQPPYFAVYSGTITVDAGATLTQASGGYTTQAMNSVTNNGTITSPFGGNNFRMRGPSFINNSSVSCQSISFDSTTTLSGTGTYTCQSISISSPGNVSLANNVTFSPSSAMHINNGATFNPNTRTFTLSSGTLYANSGGTVFNSGIFQTQNSVALVIRAGFNFNGPLKVNSGTASSYDDSPPYNAIYNGTMTVDAGATLTTPAGAYGIRANGNVTNNGTISPAGGATFRMRGPSLTNNSVISGYSLSFDSTTTLSGTGTYTNNFIAITGSGNVSLANNVAFTTTNNFTMNAGSILNPNTFIFTANGSFYFNSGSTVSNSGTFRTQGSTSLVIRAGSNFNPPLRVNTGSASVYDDSPPYIGVVNGAITVDTGATLTSAGGSYTIRANSDVTINGTLSAIAPAFRMYGTNFTNNGTISFNNLFFESGAHTLQGTGSWTTNANILNGATVTLGSNHQMQSVTINAGGTFNLSTFKLLLKASNPIGNSGTFNTTTGTVEYNGTSAQNISTTNITYNRLRINNSAGTTLLGAVTVNDTLSVILGDLNLNGFILTVSPSGYLTETPGNTVKGTSGYITTTRTLNAPSALNVGGFGAVLTTGINLGSTEIRRGHAVQNNLSGNTSILRYYDITPTTNTGLNATLVFNFDESELNGKIEAALSLFRSTNSGVSWTARGGTVNTINNNITLSAIDAYSRWSASSPSAIAAQITVIMEGFYNLNLVPKRLNMRDTVRAYLRDTSAANQYAIVDSAKSIIDSVTFVGNFLFANAPSGRYYIQLNHRNSIETWSKLSGETYTLGSAFSYNFTASASQAFGNNMTLKDTKFCIYSGDVDQNGIVDGADALLVDNASFNFVTGYVPEDCNGDSIVDGTDAAIVDNNAFNFVSKIVP